MNLAAGDTRAAIDVLRASYGDAFVFGFGAIRFHWLIGAEANRFVLQERPAAFRNRAAYRFLEPIGGPTALIVSDEPEHLRRRRRVQPAFHRQRVDTWTERAVGAFEAWSTTVIGRGSVALQPALRGVVLDLVIDVLLGPGTRTRHPGLHQDLASMMAFANQPFLAQLFRVPLPGTPWWRFTAARRRVDAVLYAEIARRRAHGADDDSVVSLLLRSEGEGGVLDDAELRDQAVSLVSAGFDTTTAALTWCAWLLCDEALRARVADDIAGLDPAAAAAHPTIDALWREALRLYPPAPAILRVTAEDVVWRDVRLPAGALVGLSTFHTHRDAASWREPTTVRLERWAGDDGPWSAPRDPFTYLPFGHGARYCIGAGLARTLAGAWLGVMLRKARWHALDPSDVTPVGTTLSPPRGLPLRFEPNRGAVVGSAGIGKAGTGEAGTGEAGAG